MAEKKKHSADAKLFMQRCKRCSLKLTQILRCMTQASGGSNKVNYRSVQDFSPALVVQPVDRDMWNRYLKSTEGAGVKSILEYMAIRCRTSGNDSCVLKRIATGVPK